MKYLNPFKEFRQIHKVSKNKILENDREGLKYDELSQKAKNKVLDDFYDCCIYPGWEEEPISWVKEDVEKDFGFHIEKTDIREYSYGRFESFFEGYVEDPEKFFKEALGIEKNTNFIKISKEEYDKNFGTLIDLGFDGPELVDVETLEISVKIITPFRNPIMQIDIESYDIPEELEDDEEFDDYLEESLKKEIEKWLNVIQSKLSSVISETFEDLISEESIKEYLEINEILFDENGDQI